MLSPLIAKPFLAQPLSDAFGERDMVTHTYKVQILNTSFVNEMMVTTHSMSADNLQNELYDSNITAPIYGRSSIQFPYGVIAVLEVMLSFVFMVLFCKKEDCKGHKQEVGEENIKYATLTGQKIRRIMIIIVEVTIVSLGSVVEVGMGILIAPYCVKYLNWSKTEAANITSVFWAAYAASRLAAVFLDVFIKPTQMIFGGLLICVTGCLPVTFALDWHPAVLWVSTISVGIGMANLYPTILSWTEHKIKATEVVISIIAVGATLGYVYTPGLLTFAMENTGHMSYIYILQGCSCVVFVLMVIAQILAVQYHNLQYKLAPTVVANDTR